MACSSNQPETQGAAVLPGGCLVLAAPGQPTPKALLRALASRGLAARLVHDEPSVMAMFAERALGRRVLIIVEPGRWRRLAELVCAVYTYHGEVLCWQYARNGSPRMHLSRLDQRFRGPVPVSQERVSAIGGGSAGEAVEDAGPIGVIRRRRRPIDSLLTRVPGQPLSTREVVTQQELTMLLGPAPGEAG